MEYTHMNLNEQINKSTFSFSNDTEITENVSSLFEPSTRT